METTVNVDVVALGIVKSDDSPAIHYPPGRYGVAAAVDDAMPAQGVLAGEGRAGCCPRPLRR